MKCIYLRLFKQYNNAHSAGGRDGRVTDCGVRGLGFKSPSIFLLIEQEPVLYHECMVIGMVETHALYS